MFSSNHLHIRMFLFTNEEVCNNRITVPWLRWLVTCLSWQRLGLEPRSVCVGFVVKKLAPKTGFSLSSSGFLCEYHFTVALHNRVSSGE
jgi:hypothetical protein